MAEVSIDLARSRENLIYVKKRGGEHIAEKAEMAKPLEYLVMFPAGRNQVRFSCSCSRSEQKPRWSPSIGGAPGQWRRRAAAPVPPAGQSLICSQRPSCVGLTTPGMWAPLVLSSQDTSAYLLFGSGSARAAGAGAGAGPARPGSIRRPRSVPWARNSCARWPASSLLLPPAGPAGAGLLPGSALAGAGACACACAACSSRSRSLRLPRAARAASSFSLSDISTAPLRPSPRQRGPSRRKEEKKDGEKESFIFSLTLSCGCGRRKNKGKPKQGGRQMVSGEKK
ncbi:hypothetical protein PVAP13_7KG241955 [Panicum virgatum]|uniref:Uncharacterized protein n=1 Tax=Panicum virgatum TaxID=38727 RepID=A0A8T0QNQ0_PANVG|nr:hypothetical protein PVAP13_7KG241955 [Panicum virgatum]